MRFLREFGYPCLCLIYFGNIVYDWLIELLWKGKFVMKALSASSVMNHNICTMLYIIINGWRLGRESGK